MMYVVKYKERVILGLIPWNWKYITDVLMIRHRVTIDIPIEEPQPSEFPLRVHDDVTIYIGEENIPKNMNPMTEYYYGPTWEFLEDKVIAKYEIVPLELQSAKNNYKNLAAKKRYEKEIEGVEIVINNTQLKIETSREERSKYIEKLISIDNVETLNWKFKEGWMSLSKQNLQYIVQSIDSHIQSAYDYEYNLNNLIDNAVSSNDLLNIQELNESNESQ